MKAEIVDGVWTQGERTPRGKYSAGEWLIHDYITNVMVQDGAGLPVQYPYAKAVALWQALNLMIERNADPARGG